LSNNLYLTQHLIQYKTEDGTSLSLNQPREMSAKMAANGIRTHTRLICKLITLFYVALLSLYETIISCLFYDLQLSSLCGHKLKHH